MKRFYFLGIVVGLLIAPFLVFAVNLEELIIGSVIRFFLNWVAQFQSHECHDFNTNLRIGDEGEEVKALQIALVKEGFLIPPVENRQDYHFFGEFTASAVVGFQQKYHKEILAPLGLYYGTGFVGTTTRAKLNELYGCSPTITVLSPNGGEVWKVGETKRISWRAKNVKYVRIYIEEVSGTLEGSGALNYIYDGPISASQGYYDWTIQKIQLPGGFSLPRNYKIRIDGLESSGLGTEVKASDFSDTAFTIIE